MRWIPPCTGPIRTEFAPLTGQPILRHVAFISIPAGTGDCMYDTAAGACMFMCPPGGCSAFPRDTLPPRHRYRSLPTCMVERSSQLPTVIRKPGTPRMDCTAKHIMADLREQTMQSSTIPINSPRQISGTTTMLSELPEST